MPCTPRSHAGSVREGAPHDHHTPGSVRTIGTLRATDGLGVVRLEDRFDTDLDDLWSALTDPLRLARWLGEVDGDLRRGGEFRAHFFASGWEGTGRVEVCEPPHRLLVTTRSPDQPDGVVEATLTADGDGHTVLVIEDRGVPAGPDRRLRGRRPGPRRGPRRLPRRRRALRRPGAVAGACRRALPPTSAAVDDLRLSRATTAPASRRVSRAISVASDAVTTTVRTPAPGRAEVVVGRRRPR